MKHYFDEKSEHGYCTSLEIELLKNLDIAKKKIF